MFCFHFRSGYPSQSPLGNNHPNATRSSIGSLTGRGSITDSFHGGHPTTVPMHHSSSHSHFQPEDGIYGNHDGNYGNYEGNYGVSEGNYGNYGNYNPNLTNSVFEDSGEGQFPGDYPGGMPPLQGTLGSVPQSVSHTPLPREAPRAVFDEDQEQEPAPINHPGFRPKSSIGSDHNKNQPGLFLLFYFRRFFY